MSGSRKTTQTKGELIASAVAKGRTGKELVERPERLTLAEGRDKLFENFYTNLRILVAAQTESMVDLSRQLGLKSGARISDLCYGRGIPSTEELIVLSRHFKCTIDDFLYKTAKITWA